ncbi:uncharacterized protein LOC129003810 isoform X2 [Macrosteles quadrilineatus]|uniref:uncharacterized protein LOC129003810 isoform X2 n=1 Tax=Macrosteles quadrilineatus TaxID=74068 RepID=UPI0023E25076|nr:uncharacterized protein LOC129003810 isoform X2 [Macrosteles quadrilineatus]
MADQQFCLRWNNHQSTLISVFDTLLENGTLVDCTLAAEGQYLKAHKVVLCACSPYLEALLSQHYEKHPIVILKDVKFSELKSMMDYMYRGEVNISQDQLGTFLKAAESLQIKGLSDNGADGDARDVGSTPKAPPPRKPNVPAPSSRSEPARPDSPLTDGSMSPSSRKRRRVRRSSQDEDSHIENNCDLPSQAQSTPVPNIPAATSSITTTPIVKPAIVKPEQTEINRVDTNSLPADVLKKEIEPISEPLLEPKTEYLEDVNNEDSVEDLTLDDDDDMDGMDISNMSNMSNMSRPGPSHGNDISNQGFAAWNLGANQSGTDEVFMAAQEAVNQHRDSQGSKQKKIYCSPRSTRSSPNSLNFCQSGSKTNEDEKLPPLPRDNRSSQDIPANTTGNYARNSNRTSAVKGKRVVCSKCEEYVPLRVVRLHKKYYCGKTFDEKEWKLSGCSALCLRCKKYHDPESIEFHVNFVCDKIPIIIQCFYCPRLFKDHVLFLKHINASHRKRHCLLDLLSVLPAADSKSSKNKTPKVVKNFFSNMLNTEQEAVVLEDEPSNTQVQIRDKEAHTCETCGKILSGTHEYVNHINTKCGRENHYPCFYCAFKSILAYEVLDHMEDIHGKLFNTFDIIQAMLTGIIPFVDQEQNVSETEVVTKKPKLELISKQRENIDLVNESSSVEDTKQCDHENYCKVENHENVEETEDARSIEDVSTEDSDVKKQSGSNNAIFQEVEMSGVLKNFFNLELSVDAISDNLANKQEPEESRMDPIEEPICDENLSDTIDSTLSRQLDLLDSQAESSPGKNPTLEETYSKSTASNSTRNSSEKLKKNKVEKNEKHQNGILTKTSPKSAHIISDELLTEDPEVEFANKDLFEPNFSSRMSRSTSNQIMNIEAKNKLLLAQSRNNDSKKVSVNSVPSDSEIDFANKDLFEPYQSSSKRTLSSELPKTRTQCLPERKLKKADLKGLNKMKNNPQTTKRQTISRAKISLKISKKRIFIGKKPINSVNRKSCLERITCKKCCNDVLLTNVRTHKKYCHKETTEKRWVLYGVKALCLKCRKSKSSDMIDFHVTYLCNQKKFAIQCLYCSKISKNFKSVVVHMFKAHNKKHYYQDFITIIPAKEADSSQMNGHAQLIRGEGNLEFFAHPTTYNPKKLDNEIEDVSLDSSGNRDDFYNCFYCNFKHSIAYRSLDHMEEVHSKTHNLYHLLDAKFPILDQGNCCNASKKDG